jgi:hypothetical protein
MKVFAGLLLLIFVFLNLNCKSSLEGSPITSEQGKIFSYIPARTQFIAYFNLDNIRNTAIWKNNLQSEIEDQKFDDWINSFNNNGKEIFDKEVSKVVISKSPNGQFFLLITSRNPFNLITKTFEDTSRFKNRQLRGEKYYYNIKNEAVNYYEINDCCYG